MLSISKVLESSPVILKISGRIDGITSKQVQTEIDEVLDMGHKEIILDFADVYYLSSAGIRIFIAELKKTVSMGGKLYFVALSSHIHELFKISGLTSVFTVFDTYQDFISAINSNE